MTLILGDTAKAFKFVWCRGASFGNLVSGADCSGFICYISTERSRIYLVGCEGKLEFRPYEFTDNAWRPLNKHQWVVDTVSADCLKSEDALLRTMEFQIIKQWRDSITGYYYDAPEAEDILARLGDNSSTATLDTLRVTYFAAEVQQDDEWDGAIQVPCKAGVLLLPYRFVDNSKQLLKVYATFVPDSPTYGLFKLCRKVFCAAESALQNLHWSNLRLHIEKVGGKHG